MKIIRADALQAKAGITAQTAYRLERANNFPKRRQLSGRAVGWVEEEIDQWLQSREYVKPVRDTSLIGKGKPGPGRGHRKLAA